MDKIIKTILEYFVLWCVGGTVYFLMETAWRDDPSHWTMLVLGGILFVIVGIINQHYLTWNMNIFYQMFVGMIVITIGEFITGCVVNLWLGWDVWHYEHFDILGQICLPFMILWYFLSALAIAVDDFIRHWLFNEEKPHYYFFKKKDK